MAISDITSFQKVLDTGNARGWTREVNNDFGSKFAIETPGVAGAPDIQEPGASKTFGEFLQASISQVNNLQIEANTAMEKLASGESQNLHETLLAVEKADIAFRTMNQVRSKVIDAYREIMRMQI
ncbi:MAG TPA: flagellar hook-basal body complex protein FliE [Bacteriovoracaceae bacterium]|nr:flagellar hook-basal body complex protein FliE [Bacteriovoracaceae bacterium]